jgi:hypothetical protein
MSSRVLEIGPAGIWAASKHDSNQIASRQDGFYQSFSTESNNYDSNHWTA